MPLADMGETNCGVEKLNVIFIADIKSDMEKATCTNNNIIAPLGYLHISLNWGYDWILTQESIFSGIEIFVENIYDISFWKIFL